MKISFCTWNCNRGHQLQQTLAKNLETTRGLDVEFCIVDIGSNDGSREFLKSQSDPRLRIDLQERQPLHFAKMYNKAHALATGDIMVTLDGDNFLGPRFCNTVLHLANAFGRGFVLHAWSGNLEDGTCGRIVLGSSLFHAVGGYDEDFEPVGYQDLDLRDRAATLCGTYVTTAHPEVVGGAIKNTIEERNQVLKIDKLQAERMNMLNRARSTFNIRNKVLKANTGRQHAQ